MPRTRVGDVSLWYEQTGAGPHLVQIGGAVSAHEGYATVTKPGFGFLEIALRLFEGFFAFHNASTRAFAEFLYLCGGDGATVGFRHKV